MNNFFIFICLPCALIVFSISSAANFSDNCTKMHDKTGLVLAKAVKNHSSCMIKNIIPLSRAWYSKLRVGNRVISINQIKLNQSDPCQDLSKKLKKFALKRQSFTLEVVTTSSSTSIIIPAAPSHMMSNQQFITPDFFSRALVTKSHSASLIQLQDDLQKNWLSKASSKPLFQMLACLPSGSPTQALPIIEYTQSHPLKLASVLELIKQRLTTTSSSFSLANFLTRIQSLSYQSSYNTKSPTLFATCHPKSLLDELEQFLYTSHQLSSEAFAQINIQDREFFITHYEQLHKALIQSQELWRKTDRQTLETISQLFEIAAKVDYAKLSLAAEYWYLLAEHKGLQRLIACLPELDSSHHQERETPYGKIVIGTHKDDSYTLAHENDTAIIIDPSGNDHYIRSEITPGTKKYNIYNTAIIDLSGNDYYDASSGKGFAFATLGIALLVDWAGDDQYAANAWAQGSAFAGISALYDVRGNDQYLAQSFSQAVALFGSGLLVDQYGHDTYTLKHHGQGLGLPYGHGIFLDDQGNDYYLMQNGLSSTYANTEFSSESWGQGTGKGFRHILPGGIGILLDEQGNNTFSAQEFAQGGGYYYGMGLLYSLGNGNDQYRGSRYNAGYAAHQAIGGFIETAGNDRYYTAGPAFCGSAWDQSISLFFEQSGNDTYVTQDFSLAAAAHNSIASFWDISGQDKFSPTIQPACITSNQYHGGHSLSYFFSGNEKIPGRLNTQKQEFVITVPSLWQQPYSKWANSHKLEALLKHNNALCQ